MTIIEQFRDRGYEVVVHETARPAVQVISDFIDCYKNENEEVLTRDCSDEEVEIVSEFLRKADLLRRALNPDAILSPGQQELLKRHLHFRSEMDGLGEPLEIMQVVNFIHECARNQGT